ncbi:MAG TPA: helix-turn-helix domain-containing protein [Mycobacteriales bacterium]|nr:helix-turn-helix domain-containing protein [Mycobacteriales bacterium]
MAKLVKSSRSYDSSRRQTQARQTQLAVVRAAQEQFLQNGYGGTTMAEIARAAEVSVETVYAAFGTKAALLHRVWDITVGGDDQDVLFHDRPEAQAVRAEPDLARRFVLHARVSAHTATRIGPFRLMVQAAAAAEPAAAEMVAEMDRQRYEGMRVMAAAAAATGQLAVSEEECRDVLWATTDGTLWHALVSGRGWTDERFATWLGQLWTRMLVRT